MAGKQELRCQEISTDKGLSFSKSNGYYNTDYRALFGSESITSLFFLSYRNIFTNYYVQ